MLVLHVSGKEFLDEQTNEFIYIEPQTLQLEHSLLSISKWESKWHKSYLSATSLTQEEAVDYIRCMTITTKPVDMNVYRYLTEKEVAQIKDYIHDPMTATIFSSQPKNKRKREIITSELIYYWMTCYGIPFECEKWHIGRLMTLINVCAIKEQPPDKKMKRQDLLRRNASLNAQRRALLGTRG